MKDRLKGHPIVWSSIILALCLALTYIITPQEQAYLIENNIALPEANVGGALLYFAGSVLLIGGILFLIPRRWLQYIMKGLFTMAYAWGIFICFMFFLPWEAALAVGGLIAIIWTLRPVVWLHTAVMVLTMAGTASIFGPLFSPWTFVIVMLIISVYDFLAVRFGYMVWMADRLSETSSLPAFIIPRSNEDWKSNLGTFTFKEEAQKEKAERQFSVLGGGDIAFPLIMVVSVLFSMGFGRSLIVAASTFVGLALAYLLQAKVWKGKPMPALPPISAATIIGFLIAYFLP